MTPYRSYRCKISIAFRPRHFRSRGQHRPATSAYANSKAFAMAGITGVHAHVKGGGRLRQRFERPTHRRNFRTARDASVHEPSLKSIGRRGQNHRLVRRLARQSRKQGVTTVTTPHRPDRQRARRLGDLHRAGQPPNRQRTHQTMPDFQEHDSFDKYVAGITARAGQTDLLSRRKLSVPCVKFWTDGSLQGYTGALTEPYLNSDKKATSTGRKTRCKRSSHSPRRTAGAAPCMPTAMPGSIWRSRSSRSLRRHTRSELSQSREHCTVTRPSSGPSSSAWISRSRSHEATSGSGAPAFYSRILGPQRASESTTPSEHRPGLVWSMNSDYATTDIQPLRYIQTAVTRMPIGAAQPLGPHLRTSVQRALKHTINGRSRAHSTTASAPSKSAKKPTWWN